MQYFTNLFGAFFQTWHYAKIQSTIHFYITKLPWSVIFKEKNSPTESIMEKIVYKSCGFSDQKIKSWQKDMKVDKRLIQSRIVWGIEISSYCFCLLSSGTLLDQPRSVVLRHARAKDAYTQGRNYSAIFVYIAVSF